MSFSYLLIIQKMISRKRKLKSNKNYADKLPDFLISLVGTIIGIFLTVGVTYCSEKHDKEVMARKAVMLTIHNIDVSVRSMERLIDEMNRQDSIFSYVRKRYSSSPIISRDTMEMFVSALYARHVRPIDTSTEAVFSSNFEIWRYIDDPKVIGRISNCYSLMEKCGEEYDRIEKDKYDAFIAFYDSRGISAQLTDAKLVGDLLNQGNIIRIIDALPMEIDLLRQLTENAKALNERNKYELKVNQEELDKIGNLL